MDTPTKPIILPVFYLPSIAWFAVFINEERPITLEIMENFPKQTYRNRAEILAANGNLTLSIPIQKKGKEKMKDITISFAENWKAQHWKSIQSAYQASPYFDFYQDKLSKIYDNNIQNLVEFNRNALDIILNLIKSNPKIEYSTEYETESELDFRNYFSAKKDLHWEMEPYFQVFSGKFDFIKNLSILDLICNKGPETATYLTNVYKLNRIGLSILK